MANTGSHTPPVPYQCPLPIAPLSIIDPCAIAVLKGSNAAAMTESAVDSRELVVVSMIRVSFEWMSTTLISRQRGQRGAHVLQRKMGGDATGLSARWRSTHGRFANGGMGAMDFSVCTAAHILR
jgi:hypothetical protein